MKLIHIQKVVLLRHCCGKFPRKIAFVNEIPNISLENLQVFCLEQNICKN